MKSKRVIFTLFLIFCVLKVNAKGNTLDADFFNDKVQIDSLYSTYTEVNLTEKNASKVINWYQKAIANGANLSNEEYKRIALSYGYLGQSSKAQTYLNKYIKNTYDITILDNNALYNIKNSREYEALVNSYKPKIDGWILFFIASGIIGFFVAIVLNLRKKGDTIANLLIGVFVLFHSLFILHLSLYLTNYSFYLPHSYWATITFSFAYGPLLYFYFKRISEKHNFRWKDLIHFAPTLALIIYFIPIYILPSEVKLHKIFNVNQDFASTLNVIIAIKAMSILIYGILTLRIYLLNRRKNLKLSERMLKWQRNMSILNLTYALSYIVYAVILATHVVFIRENNFMLYSQVVLLASIVLYVAYTAYVQPRLFSKKYLFDQLIKYKKSGLNESFSNDLKQQLLHMLNEEKIYKINNISLDVLSDKLSTTRHNISQVINEHFEINFFNLINRYRILEAQQIFKEDWQQNLNIIDVAYEVGFNNKVTFNKAFKEETKLTPTQFLRRIHSDGDLATSA